MRFKFKAQTALLVGGLLAATYASACYYSTTQSGVCAGAGSTVNTITWQTPLGQSRPAASAVIAQYDWIYWWNSSADNGKALCFAGSGAGGYYNHTVDIYVNYCIGPVWFTDAGLQVATVPYWVNGSTSSHPLYNLWYGTVSGTGCQ